MAGYSFHDRFDPVRLRAAADAMREAEARAFERAVDWHRAVDIRRHLPDARPDLHIDHNGDYWPAVDVTLGPIFGMRVVVSDLVPPGQIAVINGETVVIPKHDRYGEPFGLTRPPFYTRHMVGVQEGARYTRRRRHGTLRH